MKPTYSRRLMQAYAIVTSLGNWRRTRVLNVGLWIGLLAVGLMTRSLFSSPSHYDLVYRKSRLAWSDVVATDRRTYIPYATFCSVWDCLPYVLLSVGLLLETGVRTTISRPTSKCFSNRHCELVGVPNYLSCVKTEVGLHSKDVSL